MINLNIKNCQLLKDFRLSKNVTATDIATEIGRSNAYVTKLEKGDYKTIDDNVLNKIIQFISKDINEQKKILESILYISKEQSILQQIKYKLLEVELYTQDFTKALKSFENNIHFNEKMTLMFEKDANEKLITCKNTLHSLIDQISF